MIDAITDAWVLAIGGQDVIGLLYGIAFLFVIAFVFYKIST